MDALISVSHLTKRYGKLVAVDDLSFDVARGEVLGLLGPNGSGKTTTLNCLLALLRYDSGTITAFGSVMNPDALAVKRHFGVVFQDVAVFEELSVQENIDYFCGLYVADKKTRRHYVEEAIAMVGLEDFRKFRPKQLSGGLLRRLNIACGIAHHPEFIIFDEPTVAVDPQSRNRILEAIQQLNQQGATILYTTHYMEEVEQLCDRILILDKGKILAQGTKESLKASVGSGDRIVVDLEANQLVEEEWFKALEGVLELQLESARIRLLMQRHAHNVAAVINLLEAHDLSYQRVNLEMPTLNDVFLQLTGKELRD